jgi:hypothetical protein
LHGETIAVSRATELIELDLGDGSFATYRITVSGGFSYEGIHHTPTPTVAGTRVVSVSMAAIEVDE